MKLSQSKLTLNIFLDRDYDIEDMANKLRTILKQTSDYQHDAISCSDDIFKHNLIIDIYSDEFRDAARSRRALKEAFDIVIYELT